MRTFDSGKLINESPLFFVCGISLFLIALLIRFSILPDVAKLTTLKREFSHYKSLISSEKGIGKIKEDINHKIEILRSKLNLSTERKILSNDVSQFLEMLISVARKNDIRFVRIQPQKEESDEKSFLYPIILVFTATYHELGQFIASLEKMPTIFSINRVAVDAAAGGKCDVKLLVTCIVPKEEADD